MNVSIEKWRKETDHAVLSSTCTFRRGMMMVLRIFFFWQTSNLNSVLSEQKWVTPWISPEEHSSFPEDHFNTIPQIEIIMIYVYFAFPTCFQAYTYQRTTSFQRPVTWIMQSWIYSRATTITIFMIKSDTVRIKWLNSFTHNCPIKYSRNTVSYALRKHNSLSTHPPLHVGSPTLAFKCYLQTPMYSLFPGLSPNFAVLAEGKQQACKERTSASHKVHNVKNGFPL